MKSNPLSRPPYSSFSYHNTFSLTKAFNATIRDTGRDYHNLSWILERLSPSKTYVFTWLSRLDCLPAQKMLYIRKIISSPICTICGNVVEDLLHVLRDCNFARDIWNHTQFQHNPLRDAREKWIYKNQRNSDLCQGT